MTKHTPGPWHVSNGVQIRSERHQIAKVWMMRDGEGNANARLIAAAPDLLEALKGFSSYVRDEQNSTDGAVTYSTTTINHWAFLARAAIAKATGEQA